MYDKINKKNLDTVGTRSELLFLCLQTPSPDRDEWSDEPPPIRRGRSAGENLSQDTVSSAVIVKRVFSIVFYVSAWGSRQSDIYAIQGPAKDEVSTYFLWSYSQTIPELL